MAKETKKDKPHRALKNEAPAVTTSVEETFALEYEKDRKNMRIAIIGAVIVHIIFFLIQVPEIIAQPEEAKKTKVYVVQQVRFKPPPPKQQQDIPKQRAKKVPIPDPTPDEPEPIRLPDDIDQPELDMPDTDIIFGIPEGPPPAEPEGPIRVGGDVAPPVKITSPPPQYTEIARKARVQGGGHHRGDHRQAGQRDECQDTQELADGPGHCGGGRCQEVEVRAGYPEWQAGGCYLQSDRQFPPAVGGQSRRLSASLPEFR